MAETTHECTLDAWRSIDAKQWRYLVVFACCTVGCIEPDPRFRTADDGSESQAVQGHSVGESSLIDSSDAADETSADTQATFEGDTLLDASDSTTSTDTTDTVETSTASTSELDSTTSATTQTPSDTTNDSTDATTSQTAEVQRYAVSIQNPSQSRILSDWIAVPVVLDHAAMMVRGARDDGRDLRLNSINEQGELLELPFVLDRDSDWGQADTLVWFAVNQAISPGSTSQGRYELSIDPAQGIHSPYDPTAIFVLFDDFTDTQTSGDFASRWSMVNTNSAAGTISLGGGLLRVEKDPTNSGQVVGVTAKVSYGMERPVLESRVRLVDPGESLSCFTQRVAAFADETRSWLHGSGTVGEGNLYAEGRSSQLQVFVTNGNGQSDSDFHTYALRWEGNEVAFSQDGQHLVQANTDIRSEGVLSFVHLGIQMSSDCGRVTPLRMEVDWIRLRNTLDVDPIVQVLQTQ